MITSLQNIIKQGEYSRASGVFLLSDYIPSKTHEEIYLNVRTIENRLLSDEVVKMLPTMPTNFPHHKEWLVRKQTANQFGKYLIQQAKPLQVLDLGCGNGWFSAKVASIPQTQVIGLDLNLPELKQAQRLFGNENLNFCYGNIFEDLFAYECFDLIVLNASIQYFPTIDSLLKILLNLLHTSGEIHILDSPFYKIDEVENARKRSRDYYTSIGHPEMGMSYFHHTFQDLKPFSPIYKTNKSSFLGYFLKRYQSPFRWVILKKK